MDTFETINPVYNTAKFTLTMLAETGVSEASQYLRILGFSDREEKYGIPEDADATKKINYIALEARYKFLNRIIEEEGYSNVLDLACGFSPRGLLMERKGVNYVGGDLPATVKLLTDAGSKVNYKTVDVTNPSMISDAAASFEGPIAIITEGLFMYLSRNETAQFLNGIRSVLKRNGGCFYTPDFSSKSIFYNVAAQAYGREKAIEILTKYRDTLNSTSQSSISDTLVGRDVAKEEQLAFFNKHGFVVEEIPFLTAATDINSLNYFDKDIAEKMRIGLSQVNGWKVSLDENYAKEDNADNVDNAENVENQVKNCSCMVKGNTLHMSLFGRIDTISSPAVYDMFEQMSRDKDISGVDIDMKDLEYISSAGLRVLLLIAKRTKCKLKAFNVITTVREIIETTGFDEIVEIASTM